MGRRLRIKLEIVSPTMSMTTEIGRIPKENFGSDPTEDDFKRAHVAMRLICGMPMRDEDVAIWEAAKNGRTGKRRG